MALIPFDDRDGALVAWQEEKLHVLSHGMHHAGVVIEGEPAYGGNVFKLAA
jgi:branched-chain amino acid aminotransferase